MSHKFADIAFTETVKRLQQEAGSRNTYARMEASELPRNHTLGPREAAFIGARDSFYMATTSETGWPYVQHRGGPKGFVRVLDDATIGFADYGGNRQFVSVGNLTTDDRVSLFFMDYPNRARLKLFGRVRLVDPTDGAVMERLDVGDYAARIERGFLITVEGFDWNCSQHIAERYTLGDIEQATAGLRQRIADLEAELASR